MNPVRKLFLLRAEAAAKSAGHIFPAYAACEAALESYWGESMLASAHLNLFGMKQHLHPIYGTVTLPTREFLDGGWVHVTGASFVSYPTWDACFQDRMATLTRLAPKYPHYAKALAAKDGNEYVLEVSASWATDPNRAQAVLEIYDEMTGDWSATDA